VPGVGIDDELAVRESSIEVDGVLGGHHLGRRELPPTLGPAHANQRYAALRSSGRRPARLVGPAPGVSCSCAWRPIFPEARQAPRPRSSRICQIRCDCSSSSNGDSRRCRVPQLVWALVGRQRTDYGQKVLEGRVVRGALRRRGHRPR
jgi:hypothetical protein